MLRHCLLITATLALAGCGHTPHYQHVAVAAPPVTFMTTGCGHSCATTPVTTRYYPLPAPVAVAPCCSPVALPGHSRGYAYAVWH